jgi:hypothetical protein
MSLTLLPHPRDQLGKISRSINKWRSQWFNLTYLKNIPLDIGEIAFKRIKKIYIICNLITAPAGPTRQNCWWMRTNNETMKWMIYKIWLLYRWADIISPLKSSHFEKSSILLARFLVCCTSDHCWCIWKSFGVNTCLHWRNVFSFHWRSVFVVFCEFFEFIFDCTCVQPWILS